VLLDLDLGISDGDGTSLIRPLTGGGCRVLVVTGSTDLARWGRCLEEGAVGVVAKSLSLDDLLAAARRAAAGEPVMDEGQRHRALSALRRRRADDSTRLAPFERLTPREQHVLASLMRGKPAAVIAVESLVSEATIRSQIRAVLTKLGVSSQLAAVSTAREAGWQPSDPS
jgi:DNA-binding NarL/FixJ family response regulator